MPDARPPLPKDGIYRFILLSLVISIIAGTALAMIGKYTLANPVLSELGVWIVVVCGLLYVFFRWLGRREAERRSREE